MTERGVVMVEIYVSPRGHDQNQGTKARPLQTLAKAQELVRRAIAESDSPVSVNLRGGCYYLDEPLVFTAADTGQGQPIVYTAYQDEQVTISGGFPISCSWRRYNDTIWMTETPAGMTTDQLFVNGKRMVMARFPNVDPNVRIFHGYDPSCCSVERTARWANPEGGYLHALHQGMWGGFHYRITGKDGEGHIQLEGGWQNNRPSEMHEVYRYVENIFEELDAPDEWYLDDDAGILYVYPEAATDLEGALVEGVRLRHLVEFRGDEERPVSNIHFRGIRFAHAARTFMETREPLLRSDWTIYRGGAVLFEGTEDCSLEKCHFDQVGGNAVCASNYNRGLRVCGCHITGAGASGVVFVGDPKAVRSPLFSYDQRQKIEDICQTPGPQTNNFPADCVVEDCLIHRIGVVEKQTAGVQISMSQDVSVRHCSIYDAPRAGINISDGTFGGHRIEYCDVFDTVKETGDHGSFNSWGRDRYWGLTDVDLNQLRVNDQMHLPLLDAVKTTTISNNRFRCDHGWDIDLDDGSSNYHIVNNLCLNGGIKLREGFFRHCENNIMVNNTFHPHVWYHHSQDVFCHNIVFKPYQPIGMPETWGSQCNGNFLHSDSADITPALALSELSGDDGTSSSCDACFVNAADGDYQVKGESSALAVGFRNFPMDRFGVQSRELKELAETPELP